MSATEKFVVALEKFFENGMNLETAQRFFKKFQEQNNLSDLEYLKIKISIEEIWGLD